MAYDKDDLDKLKARIKREEQREKKRAWNASPAGKASHAKWASSAKGRATRKRKRDIEKLPHPTYPEPVSEEQARLDWRKRGSPRTTFFTDGNGRVTGYQDIQP